MRVGSTVFEEFMRPSLFSSLKGHNHKGYIWKQMCNWYKLCNQLTDWQYISTPVSVSNTSIASLNLFIGTSMSWINESIINKCLNDMNFMNNWQKTCIMWFCSYNFFTASGWVSLRRLTLGGTSQPRRYRNTGWFPNGIISRISLKLIHYICYLNIYFDILIIFETRKCCENADESNLLWEYTLLVLVRWTNNLPRA